MWWCTTIVVCFLVLFCPFKFKFVIRATFVSLNCQRSHPHVGWQNHHRKKEDTNLTWFAFVFYQILFINTFLIYYVQKNVCKAIATNFYIILFYFIYYYFHFICVKPKMLKMCLIEICFGHHHVWLCLIKIFCNIIGILYFTLKFLL